MNLCLNNLDDHVENRICDGIALELAGLGDDDDEEHLQGQSSTNHELVSHGA